jgi:hypothetical protein
MTSINDLQNELQQYEKNLEDNFKIVNNNKNIVDDINSFVRVKNYTPYKYAKNKYGALGEQVAVAISSIKELINSINYIKPIIDLCNKITNNKLSKEEHEIVHNFCFKNKNLSDEQIIDLANNIKNHNLTGLYTINPKTLCDAYYHLSMQFINKEKQS